MTDTVSVRPLGSARCVGCGEEVIPDAVPLTYDHANRALGEMGWRVVRFEGKGWGLACRGCVEGSQLALAPSPLSPAKTP